MIISEKQIMLLMNICRRYASVCDQMGWKDDHAECKKIHQEIESQQSQSLQEVIPDFLLTKKDK